MFTSLSRFFSSLSSLSTKTNINNMNTTKISHKADRYLNMIISIFHNYKSFVFQFIHEFSKFSYFFQLFCFCLFLTNILIPLLFYNLHEASLALNISFWSLVFLHVLYAILQELSPFILSIPALLWTYQLYSLLLLSKNIDIIHVGKQTMFLFQNISFPTLYLIWIRSYIIFNTMAVTLTWKAIMEMINENLYIQIDEEKKQIEENTNKDYSGYRMNERKFTAELRFKYPKQQNRNLMNLKTIPISPNQRSCKESVPESSSIQSNKDTQLLFPSAEEDECMKEEILRKHVESSEADKQIQKMSLLETRLQPTIDNTSTNTTSAKDEKTEHEKIYPIVSDSRISNKDTAFSEVNQTNKDSNYSKSVEKNEELSK